MPKMLFTRIKVNSENKNGTKRMNSCPIMSFAMLLRTNAYTDSPANCSLEGTTAALREAKMKNTEIKITARNSSAIGFVKYGLLIKNEGRLKSFVLGGVNPSPDLSRLSTSYDSLGDCFWGKQANLIEN